MRKTERSKPTTRKVKFRFPDGNRLDGELTILPRHDHATHLVHGHFHDGGNWIPFHGRIENLIIEAPRTRPPGRPRKEARDLGAFMAYESMRMGAQHSIGEHKAKSFATRKCLELWSRWPGIQDDASLRAARRRGREILSGKARWQLTYTGTTADFSDYVVACLLPGSEISITSGHLLATGPAWIWRWGSQEAELHQTVKVAALVPDMRDMSHTIR